MIGLNLMVGINVSGMADLGRMAKDRMRALLVEQGVQVFEVFR